MRRWLPWAVFATLSLGGCPDDDDDGSGTCAPPSEDACEEPIQCCPESRPFEGGLCEPGLTCSYPDRQSDDADAVLAYSCTAAGRWIVDVDCSGGCTIDLAETCLEPFAATVEDASLEVGPARLSEPFAAFEPGQDAGPHLVSGPQGCTMLASRLQVRGGTVPNCVIATTSVSVDGGAPVSASQRVKLRCGDSLAVFAVLPDAESWCEQVGSHTLALEVQIEGIGTATADLAFEVYEDAGFDCLCVTDV